MAGCDPVNGDLNGDGDLTNADAALFADYLDGHEGATGLRLAYAWDAENRLIQVGPNELPSIPAGARRYNFAYDYLGRRIWKQVQTYVGTYPNGTWTDTDLTKDRKFVWSGWLMLMELDGNNAVVRKYAWGLDLAGQGGASASGRSALEAAGGISGLLAVYDTNGTTTGEDPTADDKSYVYLYDANGNVGQVIDPLASSATLSIKVKYQYDPYGTRCNTGLVGEYDQPFRFSTKYLDNETGLYYFGYRYYHPKQGRWMSRDPIEEGGDELLYRFARNSPNDTYDSLGLINDNSPNPPYSPYSPYWNPSLRSPSPSPLSLSAPVEGWIKSRVNVGSVHLSTLQWPIGTILGVPVYVQIEGEIRTNPCCCNGQRFTQWAVDATIKFFAKLEAGPKNDAGKYGRLPNGGKVGRNSRVTNPETGKTCKLKNANLSPKHKYSGGFGIGQEGGLLPSDGNCTCKQGISGKLFVEAEASAGAVWDVAGSARCEWSFPGGADCTADWHTRLSSSIIPHASISAGGGGEVTYEWYK